MGQLAAPARARYGSDARWASAAALPKETVCRLKKSASCDLRTLASLAAAVDMTLAAVPARLEGSQMPQRFGRAEEAALLEFCASRRLGEEDWRARGPAYFMGGLATLLASARGFDRRRCLALAESLHPGITSPEAFGEWLRRSPLRPGRFLPQLRKKLAS